MNQPSKKQIPGLKLVERDLVRVEELLAKEVRSEVRLVMEVANHILDSGGKRFRPMLTLLTGRMLGMRRKRELYSYAAALELAHTSTLLHDDVIDEAELRRGRTSANRLWGNAPSIIVGDYVLFKSFALTMVAENLRVMRLIAGISMEMAEGEAYQLALKQKVDLTEGEYEKIIRGKTALLIQACCQMPAIAMKLSPVREKDLVGFGYRLGLAFQMVDDALDYGAAEGWGKKVGKDFEEGKTTLPVIIAYDRATKAEKSLIKKLYRQPERTGEDLRRIMEIMTRTRAIPITSERAREQIALAQRHLLPFPKNQARKALHDLADFVVSRTV